MEKVNYKAALYCRISKEDSNNKTVDKPSESIVNQKRMILDYAERCGDVEIVSEMVDDGYSGSDFERPAFNQMMNDIKDGKVNCVIVKDLSRIGRDFVKSSELTQKYFVKMKVRLIAITDCIDTVGQMRADDLTVPVKHLINEYYLNDLSIKIRSQLEVKRKKGDFIAPFVPYGYKKDPNNKNKILVDEVAADVVKLIYKLKLDGYNQQKIAKYLDSNMIMSPLEYKKSSGSKFQTSFKTKVSSSWNSNSITRILTNPIYIGMLEQGKRSSPNYKVKKYFVMPEERRVKVEDNHEPIISKEIFKLVNDLLRSDTRTSPNNNVIMPLSGVAKCADCGSNMIRKNNGRNGKDYFYYVCSGHKNKNGCTSHSVKCDDLEEVVLITTQKMLQSLLDVEKTLEFIEKLPFKDRKLQRLNLQLAEKERELSIVQNRKLSVYDDFKSGLLNQSEYLIFSKRYKDNETDIFKQIGSLSKEKGAVLTGSTKEQTWIDEFKKFRNVDKLTRKLVVTLIKEIKVHSKEYIEVVFNWEDEYNLLKNHLASVGNVPTSEVC